MWKPLFPCECAYHTRDRAQPSVWLACAAVHGFGMVARVALVALYLYGLAVLTWLEFR